MLQDLFLKKNLLKSVLTGFMNSAQNPHKKRRRTCLLFSVQSIHILNDFHLQQ